jgi:hypothetical protein
MDHLLSYHQGLWLELLHIQAKSDLGAVVGIETAKHSIGVPHHLEDTPRAFPQTRRGTCTE